MRIALRINGKLFIHEFFDEKTTLLSFLRDTLRLTGTKNGCAEGHCGACTVIVNGKAVLSCRMLLGGLEGAEVETIEGLSDRESVHPLIYAFVKAGAVQCGFCTPGFIMSAKALLDRYYGPAGALQADGARFPSDEEIRKALTRNVCRCTGYVKIAEAVRLAADLLAHGRDRIPRSEILPDREGRIGEAIARIDAAAKAAGETIYADDMSFPDMLHARVLRSERPHAEIIGVNIDEASRMPDVVRILLGGDIPGKNLYGPIKKDQPVLAADRVRYTGDAIAAVFAETEAAADAAAEKIVVTYRDLPVVSGFDEALEPGAVRLHEGTDNLIAVMEAGRGDTTAGFAAADLVMEGEYETQYIEHAYLEPESCIAVAGGRIPAGSGGSGSGFPAGSGAGFPAVVGAGFSVAAGGPESALPEAADIGLTIYVASQGPTADIEEISPVVGIPKERIRIVAMPMGGGFGGKEDISVQIIAALGALATGRPVKYTFTRRESIRTSGKRHATRLRYRTGVTAEGLITAVEARIMARGGAYASVEEAVILRSSCFASGPYTVPAADIRARAVYQNHAPACAMRGFGNPVVTFGSEMTMNRIADALGIDPIELRLRNALDAGKPTLTGDRPTTSVGIRECLEAVRDSLAGYRLPEPEEGWASAVGIACSYKNVGFGLGLEDSGGAVGEILPDGTLLLRVGSVDMGQGSNSAMAQILSARTGWPFGRIRVHAADSLLDPPAGMTTASRQTFITGNAVIRMADSLNAEIARFIGAVGGDPAGLAADDGPPAPVELRGRLFLERGTGRTVLSLDEFMEAVNRKGARIIASARYDAPATSFSLKEPAGGYRDPTRGRLHAAYCFAAQATALSVNRKSGKIKIHDVFIACDAGKVINRAAIEGQMEGGVVMGLGYALSEEYREEGGIVMTDTFGKLGLLRIGQVPRIHCAVVENPHADGPYGAKGMGELPVSMGPPSVAHAVYRALGVWVDSLPITAEKIVRALSSGT